MSPVTICPWFESVNGDDVQLQDKLSILCKMFLVFNVFKNSLWLNILDRIVLVNVNVKMCGKNFNKILFQEKVIKFNFRVIIIWKFV